MKVLIERYRNIEIEFNPDKEIFETAIKDSSKESKSFAAVKKWIDEYLKDNATFEPFYIVGKPDLYTSNKRLKIIGIRKDGRFVAETDKGEKTQISEYDEDRFILEEEIHYKQFAKIAILEIERDKAAQLVADARKEVTGTTLKSVKANYLQ